MDTLRRTKKGVRNYIVMPASIIAFFPEARKGVSTP